MADFPESFHGVVAGDSTEDEAVVGIIPVIAGKSTDSEPVQVCRRQRAHFMNEGFATPAEV